ncbi:MAG: tetratricopeptide repeat protein [Chloroflexi bacterium]|nr:tetratricopeptide repeat protein [Chloroflexota bacterium]
MNNHRLYAVLLLLVLTLIACPSPSPTATPTPMPDNHVLCLKTKVYLQHGGTQAQVSQGTTRAFSVGDGVDVDNSGRARLRFLNYLVVEVFRGSGLQFESMAAPDAPPAYKFKLEGGTLYANVDPATKVVTVQSDMATITALGTKFWVHVRPGEITWVVSKENAVRITAQGRTVVVAENQQSWVLPGQAPHEAVPVTRGEVGELIPSLRELTGGETTDEEVFLEMVEVEPGADYWRERALSYREAGDYEAALGELEKAIELDPGSFWIYIDRGHIYDENLDASRQALGDFNTAVEMAPDDPNPYFHRGVYFLRHEQWEAVIEDMSQAMRRAPEWPDLYGHRGTAYRQLGQIEEAWADYVRFLEMTEGDADYDDWRADVLAWFEEQGLEVP